MNKSNWKACFGDDALKMQGVASKILDTNHIPSCPLCSSNTIRFYYHEFSINPRRSGSIWVWCTTCFQWGHLSRIQLEDNLSYKDPYVGYTLEEFSRLERTGFFDKLNSLWDKSIISIFIKT